jgi:hypothetical protein
MHGDRRDDISRKLSWILLDGFGSPVPPATPWTTPNNAVHREQVKRPKP